MKILRPLLSSQLVFFALMLLSRVVQGQQREIDSLKSILAQKHDDITAINVLIRLGKVVGKSDPVQAKQYGYRALQLAQSKNSAKAICQASNLLGGVYHNQGHYDSSFRFHRMAWAKAKGSYPEEAVQACLGMAQNFMRQSNGDSARSYLQQALSIARKARDTVAEAGTYNNLGNLYVDENNFTAALENYIKAADLYGSVPSQTSGLGRALVNIGNIENILGHYDKALEYTQRSLIIFRKNGDQINLAYCYNLSGRIYRRQSAYEKALVQYHEAVKIYHQMGYQHELSEAYHGIGNTYYDMHRYDLALDEYLRSLHLARSISDVNQMTYAYTAIGYAWYELKNFKQSLAYFDSSLTKARQLKNRYLVMDAYQVMSNVYAAQHRHQEALKSLLAYTELKDSLHDEENRKTMDEMEAKYQNTKKQSEIELLQKDRQLKVVQLQQSNTTLYALIVCIALLMAVGALLFNRYRLISNNRRRLEVEAVRYHIARDLHDDIGSTLSSIYLTSQLAIHEDKPENFVQHFQRIGEQSSRMLENMSDMVWSINPSNDSMEKMVVKMKEFCAEILDPGSIQYTFSGEDVLNGIVLNLEKRKNIFLIFKESINNASKYSNATQIAIRFEKTGNQVCFSVEDNGQGFEEHLVKAGNGLRNMRERAGDIRAILHLQSAPGRGTTLRLTLPT